MKEQKVWTKEEIRKNLEQSLAWLERGVLAIYARQTQEEQYVGETREHNGVGFNGPDSGYLSYVARWLEDGNHLTGYHVEKVRKRMVKYAGQLARIANGE